MSEEKTTEAGGECCAYCSGCLFLNKCKQARDGKEVTACSRFWPQPKSLADWIRRWRYLARARWANWGYDRRRRKAWRAYVKSCGRIASPIYPGCTVSYMDPTRAGLEGKPADTVYTAEIRRLWVDYDPNSTNGRFILMCEMGSPDGGKGSMTSTLRNCLDHKTLVAVNGSEMIPCWHGL